MFILLAEQRFPDLGVREKKERRRKIPNLLPCQVVES